MPTSVFISYAHTDRAHKDEIVKHLRSLHHAFDVQPWSDEQIGVGSVYREEIRSALDAASVAILLISVDALNSTFISEEELPHLLARRRAEGLLLIPVLVRECAWRENPWLEGLQVLNPVPLAVMSEPEREGQLARLAEHVRAHVVIRSTGPTPSAAPNARTRAARARPTLNPHNVDRDAELAIFLSLFGPDATDRVLVISGASSMGKTWFLRKCHVHLPHESTVAWIDLKNLELSIPDIILRVSENWDHGADRFPKTEMHVWEQVRSAPTHALADKWLTKSLLDEARRSRPSGSFDVIMIDHLDKTVPKVTRDWVVNVLVDAVTREPGLALVVAGQRTEDIAAAYPSGIVHCPLAPLSHADTATLARAYGLDLPPDKLDLLYNAASGNPLMLDAQFNNLQRRAAT